MFISENELKRLGAITLSKDPRCFHSLHSFLSHLLLEQMKSKLFFIFLVLEVLDTYIH